MEDFIVKIGGGLIVFAFCVMGAYVLTEFMLLGT